MPEDDPLMTRRRLAVRAVEDLAIGAAYAEQDGLDQQLAVLRLRLGKVRQLGAVRLARDDGHGSHGSARGRL